MRKKTRNPMSAEAKARISAGMKARYKRLRVATNKVDGGETVLPLKETTVLVEFKVSEIKKLILDKINQ